MIRDIENIKAICTQNVVKPKLLIIPAMRMRTQILKTLNDHGVYPVNLEIRTVRDLAYEIVEPMIITNNLILLDHNSVTDIISDVMNSLKSQSSLNFFHRLEITTGLCQALSNTILEIKNSYWDGAADLEQVENPSKKEDLDLILESYERFKTDNNYIDASDLIKLALKTIDDGSYESRYQVIYAVESCSFEYAEHLLLEKLDAVIQKASDPKEVSQLTTAGRAEFVRAYGDYNEAKEVLRNILFNQIPFDQSIIVTISNEPYAQLFYQLIQQYVHENKEIKKEAAFPITFGMGLPLLMSSPAKLLMVILQWIGDGYKVHDFINIFSSELFDFHSEEDFSRVALTGCIKNADLKWQRSTYITTFQKYKSQLLEEKKWKEEHEMDSERTCKQLAATEWLLNFLYQEAFGLIPEGDSDGLVDVEELLRGLKQLVKNHHRVSSALDVQGLNATLIELNTTIKNRKIPISEAADIIREHMNEIRIMQESPAPGRLHVTTYHTADWIERRNVFLVGLNASSFPGFAVEDPILLDCERPETMRTSTDKINNNLNQMSRFLTGINGLLIASYSCFDTIENREGYPAVLFRELLDYFQADEVRNVEFIKQNENEFLDETDFWITNGLNYGPIAVDHPKYEGKIPKTDKLNTIAGVIRLDESSLKDHKKRIDPRDGGAILSASSLGAYMKCRYKYFLKSILRIKEVGNEELDVLGWLSYFEIGHLYHKIFEEFCRYAKDDLTLLSQEQKAIDFITRLVGSEIAKYEKEMPVASEYYTERQKRDIIDDCIRFVQDEVNTEEKFIPLYMEHEFGKDGSCEIKLEDGRTFKVYGMIDRIDKLESTGEYRIIDYKSGKSLMYLGVKDPEDGLPNEASIQPILYYLALMETARNSSDTELSSIKKVREAAYRFVTSKGDYDTISLVFDADSEKRFKSAFSSLFNQMAAGQFTPTGAGMSPPEVEDSDKDPDCKFCGYVNACTFSALDVE